jgi:DNA topoisomerase-1
MASMGHVRDLPAHQMGVDVANGFKPTYEPLGGRRKVLAALMKAARNAPQVFLATDLDREGEAIAWHLAESLKLPSERIRRVIFNEITRSAISEAFANPHGLDMNKVNAQQARRILDRIVGYEISPLLWKKVARGLSAGRVQSVAVRLIVEREREIQAFVPEEYWRLGAVFTPDCQAVRELSRQWEQFLARKDDKGGGPPKQAQDTFLAEHGAFRAELAAWKGAKFDAGNAEVAVEVAKALGLAVTDIRRTENPAGKGPAAKLVTVVGRLGPDMAKFAVGRLDEHETRTRPSAPFTTATLQQAASVQLRFSAQRTMRIAQQLYEGVEIPGEGSVGLITYMRTDSRNLSAEAVARCRSLIGESFGAEYLPEKPNFYASSKRAQEAHEAVRPTDASRRPDDLARTLAPEQLKLYELIWRRFVACQMTPAVWKVTDVNIAARTPSGEAIFKAMGRRLTFDGFMLVAGRPRNSDQPLPPLEVGQTVAPVEMSPTQHFTQAPPRYTEASLVKALEADGIGRPSTYASIIGTIQDRKYVKQIDRAFHPTDLGTVVTDKLVKHFPQIFDVRFTAHMEDELDKIEESQIDWVSVLNDFYGPFSERLKQAGENMVHAKAETQPSPYKCPLCARPMVYRFSTDGRYLACTGYPDCKQTHPVDNDGKKVEVKTVDVACPKCGKAMVLRRGRFGPFLSCCDYPDCNGVVNLDKKGFIKQPTSPALQVDIKCPRCESPLNLRRGKRGPWLSCSKYPKCRERLAWKSLSAERQNELERKLAEHEKANPRPALKRLDGSPIPEKASPEAIGGESQAADTAPDQENAGKSEKT